MRSRDGSNYRLLSICTLIFFYSLNLNANEYLISFRYVVKDSILYNEELQVSKAMQKCHGKNYNTISLPSNHAKNIKQVISTNKEQFINFIHNIGVEVKHRDETTNGFYRDTTILTLKTTCFKVDFNENLVKITALK